MNEHFKVQGLQAPDGVGLRAGTWNLAEGATPRGVCVVLQGLGEFLEKYDEVAEELNRRGFAVVSADWRSQGASERGARDNRTAHVGDFDEYDHDIAILIQKLAAPMQLPIIVLAHSLGAHILLRYLHENQRRIVCATLIAPLFDVVIENYPRWFAILAASILSLRRPSKRALPGNDEHDPLSVPFEKNRVTSDRRRYERMIEILRKKAFLRINGPSFGWLRAAFLSMAKLRSKGYAGDIATPLLVFGAGKDRIVVTETIRASVKNFPNATYIEIEDAEHEILSENDAIRARFWQAFDAFVEARLADGSGGFLNARRGE